MNDDELNKTARLVADLRERTAERDNALAELAALRDTSSVAIGMMDQIAELLAERGIQCTPANVARELAEAREQHSPLKDNLRQLDLVRQMRAVLHEDGLITDQEYADLAMIGSKSARRLEDYDDLQSELSTLRASIAADFVKREDVENLRQFADFAATKDINGYDFKTLLKKIKQLAIAHGGYQNGYALSHAIEVHERAIAATAKKPTAS